MSLKDKNVIVTGGSRGLGLGMVEALVAHGARVTVVARDADALESVHARLGVATISADVTDETAAHRILGQGRPDILVLNAGAAPRMGRLDQISWTDFTATWETDVKAGLYWLQAALNLPLKPGSRVLVGSSGAAVNGSPLSGGYAGAKRMLWIMARYANGVSEQKQLGIRFQAIVPMQIIGGTGVGRSDAVISALAKHGEVVAHGLALRPGRTLAIGRIGDVPVLALPGAPDQALGAWWTLALAALDRLSGRESRPRQSRPLARKIASNVGIAEIVLLERVDESWMPLAVGDLSLAAIARSNAWLVVPGGSEGFAADTPVDAYIMRD